MGKAGLRLWPQGWLLGLGQDQGGDMVVIDRMCCAVAVRMIMRVITMRAMLGKAVLGRAVSLGHNWRMGQHLGHRGKGHAEKQP